MKNKEDIKTNGRAVFYAVLYESFRKVAIDLGYTLALHGSMSKDMDLIAVAWTEEAKPVKSLIEAISNEIGDTVWKEHHFISEEKPHGRIAYTLSIMGEYFIDLSIIPPKY